MAPDFLAALYSERYRDSAVFFRIYLCMLPLRVVAYMPTLNALNRNRQVLTGAAGELALNVALALWLMHPDRLGMAGAAWAMVIATWVQVAYYLACIRGGFGVAWRDLLPWRGLAADLAFAAVCFLPLGFVAGGARPWPALGLAALLYAVYAVVRIIPRLRS